MLVTIVAKVRTVATKVTGAAFSARYQLITYPASNPIDTKVINHCTLFSLKINSNFPLIAAAINKINEPIIILAPTTTSTATCFKVSLAIIFSVAQSKVAPKIIISPLPHFSAGRPPIIKLLPKINPNANHCLMEIFSFNTGTAQSATQKIKVL